MQTGRKLPFQPGVECLEGRTLLASHLSASLSGGLLRIEGTNHADTIVVSQENGRISVAGIDIRVGSRMQESVSAAAVKRVEVFGLGGNDMIDLRGKGHAHPLRVAATVWGGDGNDTVWAGAGPDRIYGGNGNDILHAGSGEDYLDGGNGNDVLWAGTGKDVLYGGAGNDVLHGGPGNDLLDGGAGNDVLFAGTGKNVLRGGAGNDILWAGKGNDQLFGGAGNDVLHAGTGKDVLDGGAGNDVLIGGPGKDVLLGGPGNDILIGGPGNVLDGGQGRNVLDGRAGHDVIISRSAADRIRAVASDRVLRTYGSRGVHPQGVESLGGHVLSALSLGTPQPDTAVPPGPWQSQITRLLDHINAYRADHGLSTLTVNTRLTAAAQYQASYMARTGDYSHVNLDGRTMPDRIQAAGYRYSWVGECIHLYDPSVARTLGIDRTYTRAELPEYYFDGWRVSAEHNAILLAGQAQEVGIAFASSSTGMVYAVAEFGHP